MISFNSLQRHLDNSADRARTNMEHAAMEASESGSIEDLQAFNDAQQQVDVAGIAVNESLRAKHGITKAIIDGIQ
ncbi:type III secretion protein [Pseudomonas syringae]|uniref:Type III secretion protein n=2 Tax=Pseudomonas syringae group TaxID=136849 RepID=A0A9Q4A4I0_PSESX|nr:type III secretion protein [Pseudomonas syringae]KTB59277.1 type III secretion protein [Pseudomonas viridiflava ICMP 13104]KTB84818.1 type III secretion protein [Pseudomonas syringae pv. syringae PD2766]MCF5467668.1 type III secretion protein [Pseudomonas syringae]MCF5474602.1 type III secretion protein [Pseudomonas syringae]MCF5484120.1 type III secretion protein [Pseudomonas syringae]